jgi:hypothetical protein
MLNPVYLLLKLPSVFQIFILLYYESSETQTNIQTTDLWDVEFLGHCSETKLNSKIFTDPFGALQYDMTDEVLTFSETRDL